MYDAENIYVHIGTFSQTKHIVKINEFKLNLKQTAKFTLQNSKRI
jgi:hypothetical protein